MIDMGAMTSLVSLKPRRNVFQAGRNSKLCQMLLGCLVRHTVFNILEILNDLARVDCQVNDTLWPCFRFKSEELLTKERANVKKLF